MYQILCDGYVLDDPRDDELTVSNPKCKLETNTVGESSFSISAKHPYYGHLRKKRSVFEIKQDKQTIFRGRMTEDTKDFNNTKVVDLEGVMAYFNDSIIRPFNFPEDFPEASKAENVVKFFLNWLISQHNSQVQPFQQFKMGNVTVADPNNNITRASEEYATTWETLKTKLFESSLGGYLCIRYEDDGNYIDYLEDFLLTNNQKIRFGENLLDISNESDASGTYSAVIPLGKRMNEINTESTDNSRLTIKGLPDGNIDDDIVKLGDMLCSRSAIEEHGFVCAPPSETTFEDVGDAENLKTKGVDFLKNTAVMYANTITIKAVDLHFSDDEIEGFRIYSYISVESKPHDQKGTYRLTQLDIDIHNPQNTVITLGDTTLTLTDANASTKKEVSERIENYTQNAANAFSAEIKKQVDLALKDITDDIDALQEDMEEVTNNAADIEAFLEGEWDSLTLALNFDAYEGLWENHPKYKVTGNVVEVTGCIVPLEENMSSTEKIVFAFGIPDELCPDSARSFICQGSGMNRWMLTVEADGTLTISKYGVSECVAVPTTEGLLFNGTYTIKKRKDVEQYVEQDFV